MREFKSSRSSRDQGAPMFIWSSRYLNLQRSSALLVTLSTGIVPCVTMHLFLLPCILLVHPSVQHQSPGTAEPAARCGARERSIYSAAANQWPAFIQQIDDAAAAAGNAAAGAGDAVQGHCSTREDGCSSCYDDVIEKVRNFVPITFNNYF